MRARTRGLTLLEMVIVLLIAGMALTLGFQSLLQWQRADASITGAGRRAVEVSLAEAWWTEAIRGTSAQFNAKLIGDTHHLQATTTSAVLAPPGAAVAQAWRIETGTSAPRLALDESGQHLELPLGDASDAEFAYLDDQGRWHDRWPPALGEQKALPAAVSLRLADGDMPARQWIAAVIGPAQPYYQPYEQEQD